MAIYKAISSGDASTLAIWEIWDGAAWVAATALPGASDDVYTNNNIVTITTSQSYNSWNRSSVEAPYNITQGGQFQIDGANEITLTGQVNGSNVTQTSGNPLSACVNRLATHTNTLHRVGDDVGGSAYHCYGFWNGSTYDIDLVGNQQGGNASSYGFYNNAVATFTNIVGNQQGGINGTHGFYNNAVATFTSIVGNQQGSSGNYSHGFYNNAAATFTSIVGNQQGGGSTSHGFYNSGAGSIITFKNSFQKTGVCQAVYNDGNSTTIKFINCRAYANSILNTKSTTTINFQGITYNDSQNGTMAIRSLGTVNFDLSVFYIGLTPTYTDIALYPASTLENPPATTDVRSGVVYGIGDAYEGTLAVPPPESVVKNVPVDDTVGTWAFDDDLILRLKKCSTTEEVDMELIKTKLQAIQEDTTNMPENVTTQLKQDVLGQRLSKVATLEELMGILTSLLK